MQAVQAVETVEVVQALHAASHIKVVVESGEVAAHLLELAAAVARLLQALLVVLLGSP
jgi:hypothetical protein